MMNQKVWAFAAFLGLILASSPVRALELAAVGGLDVYDATYSLDVTGGSGVSPYSSTTGAAFGVLASHSLLPTVELQLGALVARNGLKSSLADWLEASWTQLQIPLMARFRPINMLSVGAGPYLAFGLGDVTQTVGSVETSVTHDTAHLSSTDFGLVFGVDGRIPLVPKIALALDARYLFGLSDIQNQTGLLAATVHTREFQVLVGPAFSL